MHVERKGGIRYGVQLYDQNKFIESGDNNDIDNKTTKFYHMLGPKTP